MEATEATRATTTSQSETVPLKGFVGDDAVLQHVVGQYGITLERMDPYPREIAQEVDQKTATLVVKQIDIR